MCRVYIICLESKDHTPFLHYRAPTSAPGRSSSLSIGLRTRTPWRQRRPRSGVSYAEKNRPRSSWGRRTVRGRFFQVLTWRVECTRAPGECREGSFSRRELNKTCTGSVPGEPRFRIRGKTMLFTPLDYVHLTYPFPSILARVHYE